MSSECAIIVLPLTFLLIISRALSDDLIYNSVKNTLLEADLHPAPATFCVFNSGPTPVFPRHLYFLPVFLGGM